MEFLKSKKIIISFREELGLRTKDGGRVGAGYKSGNGMGQGTGQGRGNK